MRATGAIVPRIETALQVERACVLLAACQRIDEAKDIRDKAAAMKSYLRQQKSGREAQNSAAEITLRAERRLGELLIEQKENGERADQGTTHKKLHDETSCPLPTLADLGIEKTQAKRWQDMARAPEEIFEKYIAETKASGELTSKGALAVARASVREPAEPERFHFWVALDHFKDEVRKHIAQWPAVERKALPQALRDLADELEEDWQ